MFGPREMLLAIEDSDANLKTFLELCNLTADALAADRSTNFLPIIVAQGFFVGAIAVAIAKITANTSSTSFFINVEAHSIAFSALFFWILPAVFLSSIIGVSQTKNAVPRILKRFQTDFNHELSKAEIVFPNYDLDEEQARVVSGGIYSWQPDREDVDKLTKPRPPLPKDNPHFMIFIAGLLQRNILPLMIVIAGTLTAWLVSSSVPPDGWEPRLCGQSVILLIWLLSFTLTCLLKRTTSSPNYNDRGRFWVTWFKDLLATLATMLAVVVTQLGLFNRCDSYTRWDRTGLALPGQPDTAAALAYRINTVYPAIIFTSIVLQMIVIPIIIAIWYRHALLVFLQRDDEHSSPLWFLERRCLKRDRSSIAKRHRPQSCGSDTERVAMDAASNAGMQDTAKDGAQIEEVELQARPQFAPNERTNLETAELLRNRAGNSQHQHPHGGNGNSRQTDNLDLTWYSYYAAQVNLND